MPRKLIPNRKRISVTVWKDTEPVLKDMAYALGKIRDEQGNIGLLLDAIATLWRSDSKEAEIVKKILDTYL